jgi:hypothetical protein
MKIRLLTVFLLVAVLVMLGVTSAAAGGGNFRAHLSGGEVVPPVDTNSQGQAIFHLSDDGSELHFKLIVANIEDVLAAHIHTGAAGTNGPVAVGLYTGGLIPGRFDGILAQGTVPASESLLTAMSEGNAYVQVHTLANPPGHIRGQIH